MSVRLLVQLALAHQQRPDGDCILNLLAQSQICTACICHHKVSCCTLFCVFQAAPMPIKSIPPAKEQENGYSSGVSSKPPIKPLTAAPLAKTAAAVVMASAAPSAVAVSAPASAVAHAPVAASRPAAAAPPVVTALPAATGGSFGSSNPDVSKLFANLEGFSIPAPQEAGPKAPPPTEPMQQQKQQLMGSNLQQSHHISSRASITDQVAATYVEMPPSCSAAAARASFLLSQLEVPPTVASAISSGPSLGVGQGSAGTGLGPAVTAPLLPPPSSAPGVYSGYHQQQQPINGLYGGVAGVRGSEGGSPALPSSLLRDLSIDDDAAYAMARARLSGAGAPPPVSQPLVQQQRQHFTQPQQLLSSFNLGVSSGFPAQQPQPQFHQQPGLYGLGGGLTTQGFGSLPSAGGGLQQLAAYPPPSSQALQPVGTSAMVGGFGLGGPINGSPWMAPAATAGGFGMEPGFGMGAGGLGTASGFVPGGLAANGTSSTWGPTGLGQGIYGITALGMGTTVSAGFGLGGVPAAGSLQHQQVSGAAMQKVYVPVQEEVHSDDIGEILSLLNVGVS